MKIGGLSLRQSTHKGCVLQCNTVCTSHHQLNNTFLFVTIVIPTAIEVNFPPATLNSNYMGTCTASGNPVPRVHATLSNDDCPHTTSFTNTSQYTGQLVITIPQVTSQCEDVVINCNAGQVVEMIMLNITESECATLIINRVTYRTTY